MTNAELAVLALVVEEPRHGYAIEATVEERGVREWTDVGFSSIYYLLKKLEGEGLIEGGPGNDTLGPARTVYAATGTGQEAFSVAVVEALSRPQRYGSGLLLGLANLPTLNSSEAVGALREYERSQTHRMEHLRQRRSEQGPLPDHVEAMFDYSELILKAEIDWIARFATQLERRIDDQR